MSQDALGQLKHLKTARARWPFPDVVRLVCLLPGGTLNLPGLELGGEDFTLPPLFRSESTGLRWTPLDSTGLRSDLK